MEKQLNSEIALEKDGGKRNENPTPKSKEGNWAVREERKETKQSNSQRMNE